MVSKNKGGAFLSYIPHVGFAQTQLVRLTHGGDINDSLMLIKEWSIKDVESLLRKCVDQTIEHCKPKRIDQQRLIVFFGYSLIRLLPQMNRYPQHMQHREKNSLALALAPICAAAILETADSKKVKKSKSRF